MKFSLFLLMIVMAIAVVSGQEESSSESAEATTTGPTETTVSPPAEDDCISICKKDHSSWREWEQKAWCESKCMSTSALDAIRGFFNRIG